MLINNVLTEQTNTTKWQEVVSTNKMSKNWSLLVGDIHQSGTNTTKLCLFSLICSTQLMDRGLHPPSGAHNTISLLSILPCHPPSSLSCHPPLYWASCPMPVGGLKCSPRSQNARPLLKIRHPFPTNSQPLRVHEHIILPSLILRT